MLSSMLGLRFSRLVHAAIASGALVLAACPGNGGDTDTDTDTDSSGSSTDDPTTTTTTTTTTGPPVDLPPALVSASLVDPFTLQLSFTEPIAPVDTVNPKRFRLSVAFGYAGLYGGQATTSLQDARLINYTEKCVPCYYEPYYYYCDPTCYYAPSDEIAVLDLFNHYADPNSIFLALSTPIQPTLCKTIALLSETATGDAVLHLHYADGGLAQITDLAGLPLPANGEFWVKYDGDFYTYVAPPFSNFTPFVPIPCPF